ncbi:tRNA pseudouridine(55) synthase TruB [Candidatus Spongiisocius sp.]|uniref:tRNA pseudouridine(55) synthase TruB n=1 Tax=Candidatus Spongiisocius sp. TaxID=3101273 RepID=UPI003B5C780C
MSAGSGIMLVDKAGGWTSHDVVARSRRILGMRRIGHAGTLDPMATGLLVLGIGRATRLLRFVTDLPKEYEATALFGVATDSLDADGEVTGRAPMSIDRDDLDGIMDRFRGEILQRPPMVSAVKVGGKRLHELARRGEEVERPARRVRVDRLDLEGFAAGPFPEVRLRVVGGSGLYIRVLADDLARALGGRAHLSSLRRVASGSLRVEEAWTVEQLACLGEEGRLAEAVLEPAAALSHLPSVTVDDDTAARVRNGRRLPSPPGLDGHVRVTADGRLLAVYRARDDRLVPEVVLA